MGGVRAALWLVVLAGCAMSEEDFRAERATAHCELLIGCYPAVYPSQDACEADFADDPPGPSCVYDEGAAKACVKALAEAECPAAGEPLLLPDACDAVYTDCAQGE